MVQVAAREELQGAPAGGSSPLDRHSQQSRRLPYWLWLIIAKSLGIKLHPLDKPILATVLYTLTFMSALGRKTVFVRTAKHFSLRISQKNHVG